MNKAVVALFTLFAVMVIAESKALSPQVEPCPMCSDEQVLHRTKRDLKDIYNSFKDTVISEFSDALSDIKDKTVVFVKNLLDKNAGAFDDGSKDQSTDKPINIGIRKDTTSEPSN